MFLRGWDLLDYFRGVRPWPQLERLLDQLPRHSLYKAALDSDVEFAELAALLRDEDDEAEIDPVVPLAGYDEVALRLDNLFDAVMAVNETLIAVHTTSGALHHPNRAPRPRTAYQRLAERHTTEKLDAIVQQMTGGR